MKCSQNTAKPACFKKVLAVFISLTFIPYGGTPAAQASESGLLGAHSHQHTQTLEEAQQKLAAQQASQNLQKSTQSTFSQNALSPLSQSKTTQSQPSTTQSLGLSEQEKALLNRMRQSITSLNERRQAFCRPGSYYYFCRTTRLRSEISFSNNGTLFTTPVRNNGGNSRFNATGDEIYVRIKNLDRVYFPLMGVYSAISKSGEERNESVTAGNAVKNSVNGYIFKIKLSGDAGRKNFNFTSVHNDGMATGFSVTFNQMKKIEPPVVDDPKPEEPTFEEKHEAAMKHIDNYIQELEDRKKQLQDLLDEDLAKEATIDEETKEYNLVEKKVEIQNGVNADVRAIKQITIDYPYPDIQAYYADVRIYDMDITSMTRKDTFFGWRTFAEGLIADYERDIANAKGRKDAINNYIDLAERSKWNKTLYDRYRKNAETIMNAVMKYENNFNPSDLNKPDSIRLLNNQLRYRDFVKSKREELQAIVDAGIDRVKPSFRDLLMPVGVWLDESFDLGGFALDDQNIAQVKIEMQHLGQNYQPVGEIYELFNEEYEEELTEVAFLATVDPLDYADGFYHVTYRVIDWKGNEFSRVVWIRMDAKDVVAPDLEVLDGPETDDVIETNPKKQEQIFKVRASDEDSGINAVYLHLIDENGDRQLLDSKFFSRNGETTKEAEVEFVWNGDFVKDGIYTIEYKVEDHDGNETVITTEGVEFFKTLTQDEIIERDKENPVVYPVHSLDRVEIEGVYAILANITDNVGLKSVEVGIIKHETNTYPGINSPLKFYNVLYEEEFEREDLVISHDVEVDLNTLDPDNAIYENGSEYELVYKVTDLNNNEIDIRFPASILNHQDVAVSDVSHEIDWENESITYTGIIENYNEDMLQLQFGTFWHATNDVVNYKAQVDELTRLDDGRYEFSITRDHGKIKDGAYKRRFSIFDKTRNRYFERVEPHASSEDYIFEANRPAKYRDVIIESDFEIDFYDRELRIAGNLQDYKPWEDKLYLLKPDGSLEELEVNRKEDFTGYVFESTQELPEDGVYEYKVLLFDLAQEDLIEANARQVHSFEVEVDSSLDTTKPTLEFDADLSVAARGVIDLSSTATGSETTELAITKVTYVIENEDGDVIETFEFENDANENAVPSILEIDHKWDSSNLFAGNYMLKATIETEDERTYDFMQNLEIIRNNRPLVSTETIKGIDVYSLIPGFQVAEGRSYQLESSVGDRDTEDLETLKHELFLKNNRGEWELVSSGEGIDSVSEILEVASLVAGNRIALKQYKMVVTDQWGSSSEAVFDPIHEFPVPAKPNLKFESTNMKETSGNVTLSTRDFIFDMSNQIKELFGLEITQTAPFVKYGTNLTVQNYVYADLMDEEGNVVHSRVEPAEGYDNPLRLNGAIGFHFDELDQDKKYRIKVYTESYIASSTEHPGGVANYLLQSSEQELPDLIIPKQPKDPVEDDPFGPIKFSLPDVEDRQQDIGNQPGKAFGSISVSAVKVNPANGVVRVLVDIKDLEPYFKLNPYYMIRAKLQYYPSSSSWTFDANADRTIILDENEFKKNNGRIELSFTRGRLFMRYNETKMLRLMIDMFPTDSIGRNVNLPIRQPEIDKRRIFTIAPVRNVIAPKDDNPGQDPDPDPVDVEMNVNYRANGNFLEARVTTDRAVSGTVTMTIKKRGGGYIGQVKKNFASGMTPIEGLYVPKTIYDKRTGDNPLTDFDLTFTFEYADGVKASFTEQPKRPQDVGAYDYEIVYWTLNTRGQLVPATSVRRGTVVPGYDGNKMKTYVRTGTSELRQIGGALVRPATLYKKVLDARNGDTVNGGVVLNRFPAQLKSRVGAFHNYLTNYGPQRKQTGKFILWRSFDPNGTGGKIPVLYGGQQFVNKVRHVFIGNAANLARSFSSGMLASSAAPASNVGGAQIEASSVSSRIETGSMESSEIKEQSVVETTETGDPHIESENSTEKTYLNPMSYTSAYVQSVTPKSNINYAATVASKSSYVQPLSYTSTIRAQAVKQPMSYSARNKVSYVKPLSYSSTSRNKVVRQPISASSRMSATMNYSSSMRGKVSYVQPLNYASTMRAQVTSRSARSSNMRMGASLSASSYSMRSSVTMNRSSSAYRMSTSQGASASSAASRYSVGASTFVSSSFTVGSKTFCKDNPEHYTCRNMDLT